MSAFVAAQEARVKPATGRLIGHRPLNAFGPMDACRGRRTTRPSGGLRGRGRARVVRLDSRSVHYEGVRRCQIEERERILEIINAAAVAYRGVIPDDCWREPYMSASELDHEIAADVAFWGMTSTGP